MDLFRKYSRKIAENILHLKCVFCGCCKHLKWTGRIIFISVYFPSVGNYEILYKYRRVQSRTTLPSFMENPDVQDSTEITVLTAKEIHDTTEIRQEYDDEEVIDSYDEYSSDSNGEYCIWYCDECSTDNCEDETECCLCGAPPRDK